MGSENFCFGGSECSGGVKDDVVEEFFCTLEKVLHFPGSEMTAKIVGFQPGSKDVQVGEGGGTIRIMGEGLSGEHLSKSDAGFKSEVSFNGGCSGIEISEENLVRGLRESNGEVAGECAFTVLGRRAGDEAGLGLLGRAEEGGRYASVFFCCP